VLYPPRIFGAEDLKVKNFLRDVNMNFPFLWKTGRFPLTKLITPDPGRKT
jgi:hypothetical protein